MASSIINRTPKQAIGAGRTHVAEKFEFLQDNYRRPDGRKCTGDELAEATGGVVLRSYVSNLKKGRIQSPGLDKLEAIAGAMGFPPQLWFGGESDDRAPDAALAASLEDETAREVLEGVVRMGPKDRRLLLDIARQISPSSSGD